MLDGWMDGWVTHHMNVAGTHFIHITWHNIKHFNHRRTTFINPLTCFNYFSERTPINTPTLMDETDYAERTRFLESRLEARENVIQCQICMERDRNMVFLCGHGACKECSERLQICHVCRQTIQNRIPTYWSSFSLLSSRRQIVGSLFQALR